MSHTSTADEKFLRALDQWLSERSEVLLLIQYSRAAGKKSFEFFSSFGTLAERLSQLPPGTRVTAFGEPQLPLRGVVDDKFITKCLGAIPDGTEFLVLETVRRTAGPASWFHDEAGESHEELREALQSSHGKAVAVGQYPSWDEREPWGN